MGSKPTIADLCRKFALEEQELLQRVRDLRAEVLDVQGRLEEVRIIRAALVAQSDSGSSRSQASATTGSYTLPEGPPKSKGGAAVKHPRPRALRLRIRLSPIRQFHTP